MENTYPDVLSRSLEVTHICSSHMPLDEGLTTWLHPAAGEAKKCGLSERSCVQVSLILGEEVIDFGRTTERSITSWNCWGAELSPGQNESVFVEHLAQDWHEAEAWK